jgi:hypothetical protein
VHIGVAEDDGRRLRQLVLDEFGTDGVEVVIDDLSDRLTIGRRLFDALFPLVAVGGAYVIEHWSLDHFVLEGLLAGAAPDVDDVEATRQGAVETTREAKGEVLEAILPQLVAALRHRADVVAGLTVTQSRLVVRRGPARLDDTFELSTIAGEDGGPVGPS